MFQPWVAHWFPGMTLEQFQRGFWTVGGYVAMGEFVRESNKA